MNWTLSILGVYVLRCSSCRRRTVRIGRGRALGTCYRHDDDCPVQIEERVTAAEARVAPVIATAGATVGRYRTRGGADVTVVVIEPHAETSAPGWAATCSGCGWTDDQYACWHELWPAYPNTAAGDVRALLLDQAEEHADLCETGAAR